MLRAEGVWDRGVGVEGDPAAIYACKIKVFLFLSLSITAPFIKMLHLGRLFSKNSTQILFVSLTPRRRSVNLAGLSLYAFI